MRRKFLVLLVVATLAPFGSAAPPGKNGRVSQAGGCRKSSGQPTSTTVSSSAALRDSTQNSPLVRLQQRHQAAVQHETAENRVYTSTRNPRGGLGMAKNGTAKFGGQRHHRNQRDLPSSLTQARASSTSDEEAGNFSPWGLEDESATLMPSRNNLTNGGRDSRHHRQRRLSGLLELVQPLLSGDLTTFFTKAVGLFGPLIQMVTSLLGPFLGSKSQ